MATCVTQLQRTGSVDIGLIRSWPPSDRHAVLRRWAAARACAGLRWPSRSISHSALERAMNSGTPLPCGSPTYEGLIVMPSHFTSLIQPSGCTAASVAADAEAAGDVLPERAKRLLHT